MKAKEAKMSNDELMQAYANALLTSMSALGRNKAEMNRRLADKYANEARRRGLELPNDAWRNGTFNGPGAV